MDLGNKISKIRKDNNLTQEAFAEKYNVTRQTISSWENSKSYPDLDTLVRISDDFSISLDVLLKEDKKMIEKITKSQKDSNFFKRLSLIFGLIIGVIVIVIGVYFSMYYSTKNRLGHQFETTIKEYNFYKNEKGTYIYEYKNGISYEVPDNKVLVESKLHFFVQQLSCKINLEENKILNITWVDYNYYEADLIDVETSEIVKNVGLLGRDNVNQISEITNKINIDKSLLKDVIDKGNDLYKQFYE